MEGFENHVCCRQAALSSTIENDPDTYKAFLKSLIRAYKFYKENREETIEDIGVYVDVESELLDADTYDYDEEIANPDPDIKNMTSFYEALVDLELVEEFDIGKSLTSELYEEALDEIIKENPDDPIYEKLAEYHEKSIEN